MHPYLLLIYLITLYLIFVLSQEPDEKDREENKPKILVSIFHYKGDHSGHIEKIYRSLLPLLHGPEFRVTLHVTLSYRDVRSMRNWRKYHSATEFTLIQPEKIKDKNEIAKSRQEILDLGLKDSYDAVLFLGSDIELTDRSLSYLLHNEAVINSVAHRLTDTKEPVVINRLNGKYHLVSRRHYPGQTVVALADISTFSATLIRKEAFGVPIRLGQIGSEQRDYFGFFQEAKKQGHQLHALFTPIKIHYLKDADEMINLEKPVPLE